jgi:PAS domain S-box-containing protein
MPRPTAPHADLLQALVENSSDALVLLDDQGRVRFLSRSAERVLGTTPDDQLGRSVFDVVQTDDRAEAVAAFARCAAAPGATITSQFRVRQPDGSWRYLEAVAVNRLADPTVGGIVVNYRDVTERKRVEAALQASEEQLRHLFESAPDLIYYCTPEGRFTYVNPTASRVMKYAVRELIGRHFLTLIRDDHKAEAARFYARQTAERIPNTYFEFPAVTMDGETVWVGQHVQLVIQGGDIVGLQAIARDISKQRAAEERLRRSEARYRSLIQGAEYGIFRASADGRILDANPAFAQMLGYDSVDELGAFTLGGVNAASHGLASFVDQWRRKGEPRISGIVTWRRRDGTAIDVRLAGRIVELENQGETGFEAIAEDVTARRALEAQLRQSQKMEAVGRLARGIAHDFNNVLAAIVGCSDLLRLRLRPDDPSYVEAVEIGTSAERGAALTKRLLAFSARQASVPEVLDVKAIVRGFDPILQRLTGGVEIRLHTTGPPLLVRAEPGQIEQVVMNLVVNARDASSEGGAIDVTVDDINLGREHAGRYPEMPPGRFARIAVHDTGAGIEPDLQRHVFEPFFTTKDPAKGSGLGLSIVYGIARDAGGTVTFSSSATQGTTFEVLLPAVGAEAAAPPQS